MNKPGNTKDFTTEGAGYTHRFAWLAGIFGIIVTFIQYKGYGVVDQVEQIPIILRQINESYLINDFFVNHSENAIARRYYAKFMSVLSGTSENLPIVFFLLTLVSNAAISLFTYYTARSWFKGRQIPAIFASALVMSVTTFSLGEVQYIYKSMMLSSTIAIPLVFAGIWFAFRKKIFWSIFFSGISSLFHPLFGLEMSGLIYFSFLLNMWIYEREYIFKNIISLVGSASLLLIFTLISLVPQFSQTTMADETFIHILAHFRHPHHYLPSEFGLSQYILSIAFIFSIWYIFSITKKLRKTFADRFFIIVSTCIFILCLLGYVFVELFPFRLIVITQPFRLLYMVKWLGLILIAGKITEQKILDPVYLLSSTHPFGLTLANIRQIFLSKRYFQHKSITELFSPTLLLLAVSIVIIVMQVKLNSLLLLFTYLLLIFIYERYNTRIIAIISGIMISLAFLAPGFIKLIPEPQAEINISALYTKNVSELGEAGDALVSYVNKHTPEESIFLTPPTWGQFRFTANRAIVVDFKAFPFTDEAILEWYERIKICYGESKKSGFSMIPDLQNNYLNITEDQIRLIAEKYGTSYAVLYKQTPVNFNTIYANAQYKIVSIR